MTAGLEAEQQLLRDPGRRDAALAELEAAKQRLELLRGPGSRWGTLVGDRVADLTMSVNHAFRGGIRSLLRSIEERIETLKTPEEWDAVVRDLQTEVATLVTTAFVGIEEGAASVRQDVVDLLQDEDIGVPAARLAGVDAIDVRDLWTDKSLDPKERGKRFRTGLTGLRGAQGGVMMFGMMGQFLPGAATTLLVSNPVLLGIGAVFGGIQLFDERKRRVAGRRQAARVQLRQFVDDVQFEIGDEVASQLREVHRRLRDEFTERLGELQRTYVDIAQRAQAAAEQDAATSAERAKLVSATLTGLREVRRDIDAAAPA